MSGLGIAIGAGVNILGGLAGGKKADREAKRAAKLEREITKEELRRMDRAQEARLADINAAVGSSGVSPLSGTVVQGVEDFVQEFERERAFTAKVGASKARAIRDQGRSAAKLSRIGAASDLITGVGKFGEEMDWWG